MTAAEQLQSGDLIHIITHGREERNIEYKPALDWADAQTQAKVAKSCLAMANIPDGGWLVLGVEEKPKGRFQATGMPAKQASSFDQDDVQALVNSFADPAIDLWVHRVDHDGKVFVVVRVSQFDQVPIICKKDGKEGLNKGTVYTRSRRMAESAPVRNQTEMREILDMAVNKQMPTFLTRMRAWGLLRAEGPPRDTDAVAFREERKDLDQVPIKIKEKGHWRIEVRPTRYKKDRISDRSVIRQTIERCAVNLGGWSYPRIGDSYTRNGTAWVQYSLTDYDRCAEFWRFYQSAQFVHFLCLREDAIDIASILRSAMIPQTPDVLKAKRWLEPIWSLYTVTAVFEFAARLALQGVFEGDVFISCKLVGAKDRLLLFSDPRRLLPAAYISIVDPVVVEERVPVSSLVARRHELALNKFVELAQMFNWQNPPRSVLAEDQRKFLEGRF